MKFSELVRLLEENGFRIVKEKGSIRYYGKPGRWGTLPIFLKGICLQRQITYYNIKNKDILIE